MASNLTNRHLSLEKADIFRHAFEKKFKKQNLCADGAVGMQNKHQLVLDGMTKVQACKSCPLLACLVACEVSGWALRCNQDDPVVPRILKEAIKKLPPPDDIHFKICERLSQHGEGLYITVHNNVNKGEKPPKWKNAFTEAAISLLTHLKADDQLELIRMGEVQLA